MYSLRNVITFLEQRNPDTVVPFGFGRAMSYRGYYDEIAFEPVQDTTVGAMLGEARKAIGATFPGYKGGGYTMDEFTQCWLDEYGEARGQTIAEPLLRFMVGEPPFAALEGGR